MARRTKIRKVKATDIEVVYDAWLERQKKPSICRFTKDREDLIRKRLQLGYEASDFVLLIRWAYESNEDNPRWLRGENPRRKAYLDLTNLLVRERLAPRIEAALLWQETGNQNAAQEDDYFGDLRSFRNGREG